MVTKVGTNGRNILNGSAASDVLKGLGGNDDLKGFAGNDQLFGGNGIDRLFGGPGDDLLYGDAGNDTVNGGPGADEMHGGTGNDLILPGPEADYDAMSGGPGFDFVSYAESATGVDVYLNNGNSGGGTHHTYYSIEGAIGSARSDVLFLGPGGIGMGGDSGDNVASRGSSGTVGATLQGDGGNDSLFGDTSWNLRDIFVLQRGLGADRIYDFDSEQDIIRIRGREFGLGTLLDANELINRNTGAHAATVARAQLIYDMTNGELWLDANGTGAGGDILIAEFENNGGRLMPERLDTFLFDVI